MRGGVRGVGSDHPGEKSLGPKVSAALSSLGRKGGKLIKTLHVLKKKGKGRHPLRKFGVGVETATRRLKSPSYLKGT